MKKLLFISIAILSVSLMSFITIDVLNIGDALPKATQKLKDISGKQITLQAAKKENGLLVMFSCNTCPYVVKYQQRTKDICAYAKKMNIGVVVLNSNEGQRKADDSYAAMKKYGIAQNYKWFYAVDENNILADALGANRTPECYLFDKDLKLTYHGAIDDNANDASKVGRMHLQIAIDEMAAGKNVQTKTSKSIGCSIKRKA
jgi:thioredoxin-related protein